MAKVKKAQMGMSRINRRVESPMDRKIGRQLDRQNSGNIPSTPSTPKRKGIGGFRQLDKSIKELPDKFRKQTDKFHKPSISSNALKKGGKVSKAESGASLKPVPPAKKKSLGKLPTEVRNKMGFQKNGGKSPKKKMMGGGRCKYGC
jgi:hypothetical protein